MSTADGGAGPTRSRAATEETSGARRDRERPPAPSRCRTPSSTTTATSTSPTATGSTRRTPIAAAAAVGVPRIVQIGCDLPGARWAVAAAAEHDALVAGVALHPNEAPRLAEAGASTRRSRRSSSSPGPRQGAGRRRDRARPLPHRRGRPGGAGGELPAPHRPGQAPRQDARHPRPRRPRRRAAHHRRGGRPGALGDALLLRRRRASRAAASTAGRYLSFAGTVTFKNAAPLRDALAVDARSTGCWWRPTRPT